MGFMMISKDPDQLLSPGLKQLVIVFSNGNEATLDFSYPNTQIVDAAIAAADTNSGFEATRNSLYSSIVPVVSAVFAAGFEANGNLLFSYIVSVVAASFTTCFKSSVGNVRGMLSRKTCLVHIGQTR